LLKLASNIPTVKHICVLYICRVISSPWEQTTICLYFNIEPICKPTSVRVCLFPYFFLEFYWLKPLFGHKIGRGIIQAWCGQYGNLNFLTTKQTLKRSKGSIKNGQSSDRTWLWVARVSKYERGTIYTSQAHEFIPNFVMGPLGCSSFLLVFFSYDFSFLCFFSAVSYCWKRRNINQTFN
jgi:hypothetical protein